MTGAGWMQAAKPVDLVRSRAVRTPPEELRALLSAPSAELLSAFSALVVTVPAPHERLVCVVDLWEGGTQVRVVERLPAEDPWTLRTVGRSTGVSTTVLIAPARNGSKVRRSTYCEVARGDARDRLTALEMITAEWLERVARVAEGFEEPPLPRLEQVLAAQLLGPATASLHGSRTVSASPAEIWVQLTGDAPGPSELARFWVGAGPVAAGRLRCTVHERGDTLSATLAQVRHLVVVERLTTRAVSGGHHPCITDWQLTGVPEGTVVTLSHECATSHVELPDVIGSTLDLLERRLGSR